MALQRSENLRTSINDLLHLTSIESGKFKIKNELLNIDKVISEIVVGYKPLALNKSITIFYNSTPGCKKLSAFVDREALFRIISNLIDNALKYTPKEGQIIITLEKKDRYISIKIKDNGLGIDKEHLPNIFKEFYRVRNRQTAAIQGSGLGLCLVQKLIELHNGKIKVQSKINQGSCFSVYLPLNSSGVTGKKVSEIMINR